MSQATTGHRERKKQQTRDAIARAGVDLFIERGYEATTLADIAEAAGVSTRTIFAYFPGKEDILFCDFEQVRGELERALTERPTGKDALATLRDFIVDVACGKSEHDLKLGKVIESDETLRSHKRARLGQLRELLAAAIAVDLGSPDGDLRAEVAAASLIAAFEVLERQEGDFPELPVSAEAVAAAIDPAIAFVRAGLGALPA
jgi:AcrR family transcriptional regulator